MNWDMIGHEWAVDILRRHAASGEMRHAYLFTGPSGVGRRTLALRFAQALNCPQPTAPGEPCRACRTCRQIERMEHPDLSVVAGESEGGVLKIEQVRELQHALALAPYEAAYRVALLLRFQEANPNAANALLKTLEEAPARVVLLLTADTQEALLPTIVSRCELVRLRPLDLGRVQAALQEQAGLPAEQARILAHLSGGRVGYALRLAADPALLEERRAWLEELLEMLDAPRRKRFAYAEKIAKDKETFRRALLVWMSFWRDVLLATAGAQAPLENLEREGEVRRLAARLDLASARAGVAAVERGLDGLARNLNTRLLAEVTFLEMPGSEKVESGK